jgi:hypothetical protein
MYEIVDLPTGEEDLDSRPEIVGLPTGHRRPGAVGTPLVWATRPSVGSAGTAATIEALEVLGGALEVGVTQVVEEVQRGGEPGVLGLAFALYPLPDQREVQVIEARELPDDLLIRTTNDTPLDLRKMRIGDAGRRFDLPQGQAPMCPGAPEQMTEVGLRATGRSVGGSRDRRLHWHPDRLGEWTTFPLFRMSLRHFAKSLRFSATVTA